MTVHSAAWPSKCRTSALTISLAQSISQKARPARTRSSWALDLDRVHVDDERQQRDRRPVEQARRAQQVLGFARERRDAAAIVRGAVTILGPARV